ncbi:MULTISPECIES: hypothetical protein [unclassified Pseudoalteromonas]|uniref:hypothetical protein n=1 Tax=unclassified Pseudoalteromonas TaxID=194690 RepID=UPI002097030F|nr:hypothetical protein [Pseudoalteromonas sp. XMcav2-N]MCO7186824.1 hypothetical protein [Pseudoalteromonas sp. XMcav2-N]
MKKVVLLSALLFINSAMASTTWIPISNGRISVVIPYIPKDKFPAPKNIRITDSNGGKTIAWDDMKHASQYKIQVLNEAGDWVDVAITDNTFFELHSGYTGKNAEYFQVRVVACNYSTCVNTGTYSLGYSFRKKVVFIHTDLLGSPVAESYMEEQ